MKIFLRWAVLLLITTTSTFAQITVNVSFDQEQFLPNEPLIAKVRVLNSLGQTLVLPGDVEWLSLSVESPKIGIVNQTHDLEKVGDITIPSAHAATRKVDLNKSFDLSKLGRYTVIAEVHIPQLGAYYTSPVRHFDISPGTTLVERTFGLPPEAEGETPELRKYLLVQANHLKDNKLYVRITDVDEEHTFKIFPLGPLISFSKPEHQVDSWNNLHVLFQIGSRDFRFVTISPDGTLMTRQTHAYSGNSRPRMAALENGSVRVKGGAQRITAGDLPPPDLNAPAKPYDVVTPAEPAPAPTKVSKDKKPEAPTTLDAKPGRKK